MRPPNIYGLLRPLILSLFFSYVFESGHQASNDESFFVELPDKYTGATIYPNAVIKAKFKTENGVRLLKFLAPESVTERQVFADPDKVTIGEDTFIHFVECPAEESARELTYAEHVSLVKQLRPLLQLPAEKSKIELTDDERNPPCPCGCGGTMMTCGFIYPPRTINPVGDDFIISLIKLLQAKDSMKRILFLLLTCASANCSEKKEEKAHSESCLRQFMTYQQYEKSQLLKGLVRLEKQKQEAQEAFDALQGEPDPLATWSPQIDPYPEQAKKRDLREAQAGLELINAELSLLTMNQQLQQAEQDSERLRAQGEIPLSRKLANCAKFVLTKQQ